MSARSPQRILLALSLSLVLACLVAEGVLRFLELPAEAEEEIYFGDGWELGGFDAHPTRFYALAPNYRQSAHLAGRFATGDWPYRGRSPRPRGLGAAETLRVAILGDSCIYGFALDTRETIPEQVRLRLRDGHGWPDPEVLNLGTPAYTTYQLRLQAEEELAALQPDLIVAYPAAWNDQSPAMWKKDEIIISGPPITNVAGLFTSHLVGLVRSVLDRVRLGPRLDRAEVFERWREGTAPYDTRVPEEDLPGELDALVAACTKVAPLLLVAPAHPRAVAEALPRVDRDADAVLAAAERHAVPALDARAIVADTGGDDARWFIDRVHYNREGAALLGAAIADWIEAEYGPAPATGSRSTQDPTLGASGNSLRIVNLSRTAFSCFGGETLRLELEPWTSGDPLPEVWVGATPLLDLRSEGPSTLVGRTIADAPGPVEVRVRAAGASAVRLGSRARPRFEGVPGEENAFVFRSRPGDHAHVHVAAGLLEEPTRMAEGDYHLDSPRGRTVVQAVAGEDGSARFELPAPYRAADGMGYLQAIVVPAGEPVDTIEKRWSEVARIGGSGGG